jgi:transketolase
VSEDLDALEAALRRAMAVEDRPSVLIVRSHIAFPSPSKTDDPAAHGYALKDDDIAEAKATMGLPPEAFWVPDDVRALYETAGARGRDEREAWAKRRDAYTGDRAAYDACLSGEGLPGWTDALPVWSPGDDDIATRVASGKVLQALADVVPGLLAGGADLTSNTGTVLRDHGVLSTDEPGGRQLYFGVREHAMAATMNGMAAHGGVLPVGGTFLVFSDYCRGAVRLAALSRTKVIYSFTHDSVGVGEDGPTHQPIEHIASLRAIPGLRVIRPADANETAAAWRLAVEHDGPTALILSRQDLPILDGTEGVDLTTGAHAVVPVDDPDVVLVATGSEVHVCVAAAALLETDGLRTQVVSLPCWELFADQPDAEQDRVLPPEVPTLAVEAGATLGWERWADDALGIDHFGASAPGRRVLEELGFTPEHVAERANRLVDDLEELA